MNKNLREERSSSDESPSRKGHKDRMRDMKEKKK